ncbi:MAG: SsrA-binding protein SmpB [Bdellovibrionales bacterium]|nr:SsrA-binding protein SmpB [Bdellovibrionales bacterium]
MKIISENRKAWHDYEVLEKMEAGVVLTGSEVKSIRAGAINLKDSYVAFRGDEVFLQNAHISVYQQASYNNHEPERARKLLLNRSEINKLAGRIFEKGLSCVPLKMYFKDSRIKVEIAVVRGKKAHDKRSALKTKDMARETREAMKKTR